MKAETKYHAVLISYILILVWACIIFSLSLLDNDKLGLSKYQFLFFESTRYTALILGIVVLILRIFRVIKVNSNLLMVFAGILNGFVGLLSFLPLLSSDFGTDIFRNNLVNLIMGAFILIDVFKKRINKSISETVSSHIHTHG